MSRNNDVQRGMNFAFGGMKAVAIVLWIIVLLCILAGIGFAFFLRVYTPGGG